MRLHGLLMCGAIVAPVFILCGCAAPPSRSQPGPQEGSGKKLMVVSCEVTERNDKTGHYYRIDSSLVELSSSDSGQMERPGDVRVSFPTIWTRDGWTYECIRDPLRQFGGPRCTAVKLNGKDGSRIAIKRAYGHTQYVRVRLRRHNPTADKVSMDIEAALAGGDGFCLLVDREKVHCRLGTPFIIIPDEYHRAESYQHTKPASSR